jgi:hypothetical protein
VNFFRIEHSFSEEQEMAKFADIKALTQKVRVFEDYVEVTTVQTANTVFEAYGDYRGSGITAKATSRAAALDGWIKLAS